jgi:hypothetical protein
MKTYQPTIIKRDFKTVPFERAVQAYKDAADMAEHNAKSGIEYMRQKQIAQLERMWSETHEAPYEGNFSDEYAGPELSAERKREVRAEAGSKAIQEFVKINNIDKLWTWMMPQLVAHIATLTPVTVEGQISGLDYIKKYFFSPGDDFMQGVYRFLMLDTRSSYLTTQYKGEAKNFCSLVPLIPYAHKLHNNIPYSAWKRDEIHFVVNPALSSAMTCEVPDDLTHEILLEIREKGLVWRSGKNAGAPRDPLSTYKLYGVKETEIGHLPELAQTMLTQIWCAHPSNRTKYMVLDPKSWDNIPPPLISQDIFKVTPPTLGGGNRVAYNAPVSDLPWEL